MYSIKTCRLSSFLNFYLLGTTKMKNIKRFNNPPVDISDMEISDLSWLDGREWLLTNGLGGYSSSTLTGLNTRKYHGLLVAAFSPEDRRVLVPKIEEEISLNGEVYKLSANQYWGDNEPDNELRLKSFSLAPEPTFLYELPGMSVEKKIFIPHGLNAVVVGYKITSDSERAGFGANILATSREHHMVLRDPNWKFTFDINDGLAVLTPTHEDPPTICMGSTQGKFQKPAENNLVKGLFYKEECERGYLCLEDLFIGARLEAELGKSDSFFVVLSADMSAKTALDKCKEILQSPPYFIEGSAKKKKAKADYFYKHTGLKRSENLTLLLYSADDFIIDKKGLSAVIAGYPWFGEWGRDSLISIPGLFLTTGRGRKAEGVLINLLKQVENGMIPNNFSDGKNLNSLDTSLLFFWSVWKYLEYSNDYSFVQKHLWGGMKGIVAEYKNMMGDDGLIGSDSELPMTWMDAVTHYGAATPRSGKAVEIQALWFNALSICSRLAKKFKEDLGEYKNTALLCGNSFNKGFWNPEKGYLFDVINDVKDASIRPNALFAVSLPFPILDKSKWKSVVDVAKGELLTPYGLRTLSPKDDRYRGRIEGDQMTRDMSYHQGTVWPWLLGPFADAYKRAYPGEDVAQFLKPLIDQHLGAACVGDISEIFDGDPPHAPRGCISQAWSVAELLRVISEAKDKA